MYDGREGFAELLGTLPFEIVGSGRVAARENLASVGEAHLLYRVDEYLLGRRRSLFGRAIHADFKRVDLRSHPDQAHTTANSLELVGQQNFDGFVFEKAIRTSGGSDCITRAYGQRFFQACNDFVVRKASSGS